MCKIHQKPEFEKNIILLVKIESKNEITNDCRVYFGKNQF